MNKLKMHSPNLVDTNIEKISALFPNCITESKDENGELKKAVDFDLLKQELSQILCTRQISQNPYPIRILPS
jgi:adenine-specific DNA-methyltransferase